MARASKCGSSSLRSLLVALLFSAIGIIRQQAILPGTGDMDMMSPDEPVEEDNRVKVYSPANSTSNVAICLIVYNETIYLDEWLDFHVALGFSPIYIYDNSPEFELRTLNHTRDDLIDHIRVIHFPVTPVQKPAYDQCIKQDARKSTFVAMIDVDEFLVLKTFDNVVKFMDHHCDFRCGQLSINWQIMGISKEKQYTPVPVTKRNVHYNDAGARHQTIKVIVRPSFVAKHMHWKHSVMLDKGRWVDTTGKKHVWPVGTFRRMQNEDEPLDVAVLYHYPFKSEEEFIYKTCVKGTSLHQRGLLPMCNNSKYYNIYNGTEFDDTAWKQLTRMVPKYRVYGEATDTNMCC
ncbi:hypothetical protein ACHAXR_007012 [Thalassiosira sp. AJA248-18]